MAEQAAGRLQVRRLDVTDPATFGLPDDLTVLVNNAGVDTDYLPVEHANIDDWRRMFETNVFGTVALTSTAIPTLRDNRPAVVCTITSSSIIAAVPFYSAYRASKAAASAFCDSLRVEVAPFGIRVVEIMPGPVDTDMFRLSAGDMDAARFPEYRELAGISSELRPRPRRPAVVEPAEAASAIVDAIVDSSGPMRYGCDPVSHELIDLPCSGETRLFESGIEQRRGRPAQLKKHRLSLERPDGVGDHKRTIDFLGITTCREAASTVRVRCLNTLRWTTGLRK